MKNNLFFALLCAATFSSIQAGIAFSSPKKSPPKKEAQAAQARRVAQEAAAQQRADDERQQQAIIHSVKSIVNAWKYRVGTEIPHSLASLVDAHTFNANEKTFIVRTASRILAKIHARGETKLETTTAAEFAKLNEIPLSTMQL